jgi:hypothetical protein
MKTTTAPLFVAALLALTAAFAGAQTPDTQDAVPAATTAPHQIVVSYFHGDVRCATCKKLEAYSREAVEKTFAAEIAAGRLAFRMVNTDRQENEHFIRDYSLITKSLVVTEEHDGKVVRWTNLDKIWTLVRGDQQEYSDYVVAGVRAYLEPAS